MKLIIGLILATLGGGIQGAFVFPLKLMKNWRWENGWFVFTIACCLVMPTIVTFITTPGLLDIYRETESITLWLVFASGLAWGIGVILFGLGAEYLGMALGIAIITALNAVFGTLFPILFLPTGSFSPKSLIFLVAGLIVLIIGVVQVSSAGKIRETDQEGINVKRLMKKVSFKTGLIVCIVASIFCPATNFAVFFGQPISQKILEMGTVASYNVGYAQLYPYFIGGFIVNAIYCIYLFKKNKSFQNFYKSGFYRNLGLGIGMALLFFVGMVFYTIAVALFMVDIGPIVGWPLFMAATIMSANMLGVMSGEWQNVSKKAFFKLYSGIGILVLAIILVSLSNIYL